MNSDFSLPSALVEAFRHPESEGRPPWQLVTRKSEIVDDVSKVPDDAEYVATKGNAKNVDRLGELSQLVALWAHIPTSEFFRASARAPHLRALYAVYFKQLDEVPLA